MADDKLKLTDEQWKNVARQTREYLAMPEVQRAMAINKAEKEFEKIKSGKSKWRKPQ
jgi:hypothetical protein